MSNREILPDGTIRFRVTVHEKDKADPLVITVRDESIDKKSRQCAVVGRYKWEERDRIIFEGSYEACMDLCRSANDESLNKLASLKVCAYDGTELSRFLIVENHQ